MISSRFVLQFVRFFARALRASIFSYRMVETKMYLDREYLLQALTCEELTIIVKCRKLMNISIFIKLVSYVLY